MAAAVGPATNVVFAIVLLLTACSPAGTQTSDHARFWSALAFLGFLQVTAAVLNLLPIPGLDGYAIIEPYLDRETQRIGEKIKPWGMLGVIVLLQVRRRSTNAFFDLVDWRLRADRRQRRPALDFGHEFFKFWVKNPAVIVSRRAVLLGRAGAGPRRLLVGLPAGVPVRSARARWSSGVFRSRYRGS